MLALLLMGAMASYWPELDNCTGKRGWVFDEQGLRHPVCADAGSAPDYIFLEGFE